MYEGTPDFPDKDRWWEIVERYKVDILYTAPTAIRSHMKWGPEYAQKHDLSSLRLLGSVGRADQPRRRGSGTTSTSAAGAARSSTRGGRPRPG
jgi:acetyl-CoA synthetase